jgi:hypothetical protein
VTGHIPKTAEALKRRRELDEALLESRVAARMADRAKKARTEEEKEEAEFERKVAEEVEKRISEAADPALYGVGTDPVRQAGNNGRSPLFPLPG